ncbi:TIGR03752 family integrating conjugative element protein [Aromatoleum evansii]|uniref:TIGR03752 family integrating conjugative element protein n=1 Tax=Aromatoleum evansii TaxID=59406 RepID=UPI00145DA506|nr:TIGR03752 family integrating conjugative element protein [Aromatoleum evansii]NMG30172.1 TIGR03752 family integrating conjugative element protein [Aromatoleum evansii]
MQIAQNRLVPVLAVIALIVTGFILYKQSESPGVEPGPPLTKVPETPLPPTAKGADADTPQETLNTVVAGYTELNDRVQSLIAENRRLQEQNDRRQRSEDRIREQLRRELRTEMTAEMDALKRQQPPAPDTQSSGGLLGSAVGAANLPAGFGFDKGKPDAATLAGTGAPTRVLPLGYEMGKGADGRQGIVRKVTLAEAAPPASRTKGAQARTAPPAPTPFYTIPENATLTGVANMTTIVGRVPVDGKVTDPMQFKLLLGPENLAANGHYLPRNLAGVVVSGIAIGDMTLSCAEGLIQSMTFVFNDGSIQTVSRRRDGTTPLYGASGTAAGGKPSLAAAPKLGWISDRHGNPCIPGQFVTNAPAVLTDTIGLRSLSIAGQAAAAAQTTTTENVFGTTSSRVTGSKGTYILGQMASAGTDEVTNWLMRRLTDSFDAVVVRAGGEVDVHIDAEIQIDKAPDARRIDYGRLDTSATGTSHLRGSYYGLD